MEVKKKFKGGFYMTNKVHKIVSKAFACMNAETNLGCSKLERLSFFHFYFDLVGGIMGQKSLERGKWQT